MLTPMRKLIPVPDDLQRVSTELEEGRIPLCWIQGIARLDYQRPPIDVRESNRGG
jgi:hypothetical protein